MFKKNKDDIDEKIIKLHLNKLYGKYDILKEMKSGAEYIYKDIPINEIDESVRPVLTKKEVDLNDIFDICYNTNSNMPYCTTLKEGFTSLDNITINKDKKTQNTKQSKRNYYKHYYGEL